MDYMSWRITYQSDEQAAKAAFCDLERAYKRIMELEKKINESHVFTRLEGGEGMMGWIKPVCSCGWEGKKEYAHNDWQYTNVAEQEKWHLQEVSA